MVVHRAITTEAHVVKAGIWKTTVHPGILDDAVLNVALQSFTRGLRFNLNASSVVAALVKNHEIVAYQDWRPDSLWTLDIPQNVSGRIVEPFVWQMESTNIDFFIAQEQLKTLKAQIAPAVILVKPKRL